jgi:hypothetical protein
MPTAAIAVKFECPSVVKRARLIKSRWIDSVAASCRRWRTLATASSAEHTNGFLDTLSVVLGRSYVPRGAGQLARCAGGTSEAGRGDSNLISPSSALVDLNAAWVWIRRSGTLRCSLLISRCPRRAPTAVGSAGRIVVNNVSGLVAAWMCRSR